MCWKVRAAREQKKRTDDRAADRAHTQPTGPHPRLPRQRDSRRKLVPLTPVCSIYLASDYAMAVCNVIRGGMRCWMMMGRGRQSDD